MEPRKEIFWRKKAILEEQRASKIMQVHEGNQTNRKENNLKYFQNPDPTMLLTDHCEIQMASTSYPSINSIYR